MCIRDRNNSTAVRAEQLSDFLYKQEQFQGNTAAYDDPRNSCLLYTSDAADERSSVDLGGRRIIKKKTKREIDGWGTNTTTKITTNTHKITEKEYSTGI